LAKAEVWGRGFGGGRQVNPDDGYLGVECDDSNPRACRVTLVKPGSPAEKAGFKVGDIFLRVDEKPYRNWEELWGLWVTKKQGQEIAIEVRRGEEELTLRVKIGRKAFQP